MKVFTLLSIVFFVFLLASVQGSKLKHNLNVQVFFGGKNCGCSACPCPPGETPSTTGNGATGTATDASGANDVPK